MRLWSTHQATRCLTSPLIDFLFLCQTFCASGRGRVGAGVCMLMSTPGHLDGQASMGSTDVGTLRILKAGHCPLYNTSLVPRLCRPA